MKALIISNDEYVVSQASEALKELGLDLIVYKWLLKALDNIEEIHPDLVLVSASEYPRHWKTLVQFIKSGIGGEHVAVYLYEGNPLSEDDADKAKALGITGAIKGFSADKIDEFKESVCNFLQIKETQVEPKKADVPVEESEEIDEVITVEDLISTPTPAEEPVEEVIETESETTGYILFNNPETQIINTGKVLSFNHNKLECKFDYEFTDLANNDQITYVSYFNGQECISFSAEIFILNQEEKSAVLTIHEKYEEI